MADQIPNLIYASDLTPFATIAADKATAMIEDATAQAVTVAPCLGEPLTWLQQLAAKGILRTAILRWNEAGAGGKTTTQRTAGVFSATETLDTTHERRGVFWPSEIRALQAVCKRAPAPYTVDMGAGSVSPHAEWCSRSFGAAYCDCGVELGMEPPC